MLCSEHVRKLENMFDPNIFSKHRMSQQYMNALTDSNGFTLKVNNGDILKTIMNLKPSIFKHHPTGLEVALANHLLKDPFRNDYRGLAPH